MSGKIVVVVLAGIILACGNLALAEEPAAGAAGGAVVAAAAVETPFDIASVDLSPAYPWAETDFDQQFAPEIEAEKGKVEWKKNCKTSNGICDFNAELGQSDNVCIYARVILEAADNCKVHLSMGSDDGLAVFVNGKNVFRNNVMRPMTPDEDQADIELMKGKNEVLFRVTEGGGGWSLQVAPKVLGATKVTQVPAEDKPAAAAAPAAAPAAAK